MLPDPQVLPLAEDDRTSVGDGARICFVR